MKQILQDLKKGDTNVVDVPPPSLKPGHVLIRTSLTLISAGTERMLVEFGRSNLIDKARQQPDKVRMVLDKVKTDGLGPTVRAVRSKLDQPLPLGYSNVGVVIGLGAGVTDLSIGDRVLSNGNHAEIVCVPRNLCAKIPDNVEDEAASFTVVSAIALQGIRLLQPSIGENIIVTGLGLIGLIAVQILRANGCNVLGVDFDSKRVALAREMGAVAVDLSKGEDMLEVAHNFSGGLGVDGVLLTAATKSNEPVHQAAQACRQRGRIVLVGVTGLSLSREDFYEKELSFQVSCSYGPGRYDASYEDEGNDYPFGLVRWTEQRNFEAVLNLLSKGSLQVDHMVSHRYPIEDAAAAYDILANDSPMGMVLRFPQRDNPTAEIAREQRTVALSDVPISAAGANIGMIGSGNYASQILIPAFKNAGAGLVSLCSSGGVSSVHSGKKFGFRSATTDAESLINDAAVDTVVIASRHDSHASYTSEALVQGKHVFVEKPLALTRTELTEVVTAYQAAWEAGKNPILMAGFNRRFSPLVVKMKSLMDAKPDPKAIIVTMNASNLPDDHWLHDPKVGGGRIIGEACHYVDLLRHLVGAPITGVQATQMGAAPGVVIREDKVSITLSFEDGSLATLHYFSNGHQSFPKDRVEVFCGNSVLQLDNYRTLTGFGWSGFSKMKTKTQNKGNAECAAAFVAAIKAGLPSPIPMDEIIEATERTIDIVDYLNPPSDSIG